MKAGLLLASGSFVLANSLSLLVGYVLLPDLSPKLKEPAYLSQVDLAPHTIDAAGIRKILDRNLFNSEGTLGDTDESGVASRRKAVPGGDAVESDLPLKLIGVIYAGDPLAGLALIENTTKKVVNSFMVGDLVLNDARLAEVWDDRVILNRAGGREFIKREEKEIIRSRRQKKRSDDKEAKVGAIAVGPPPDAFKEEGFERKGHNINLTEEYKRGLLSGANFTKVLQDAKAVPNLVGNQLKGFKLTAIRENSIYLKAGLQNDDIIEEINGIPLRDTGGTIKLLNQLKSSKEIDVRVNRGGRSFDMTISIQ